MGEVRPHQAHRRACLERVGYKRQTHSHKQSGARRKTGSALLMLHLCLSLPKALTALLCAYSTSSGSRGTSPSTSGRLSFWAFSLAALASSNFSFMVGFL